MIATDHGQLTANTTIRFTVYGEAAPAGSKNAVPVHVNRRQADGTVKREPLFKNGRLVTRAFDNCKRTKPWQAIVAAAAREAYHGPLIEGGVLLEIAFYVPRRKGHFGARGLKPSAPQHVLTWYDVGKLARALEDALKLIVWRDDKQVVKQIVSKEWGEPARAEVSITALEA